MRQTYCGPDLWGCQLVFRANRSTQILLRYNPRTMSLLWLPINVGQAVLAALWSLVCAVAAIVLSKVTRSPRPGAGWPSTSGARPSWCWAGWRLDIHGLERVDPSRPYLVVANHQSWADIPVLFAALPMPILFVAKQELGEPAAAAPLLPGRWAWSSSTAPTGERRCG